MKLHVFLAFLALLVIGGSVGALVFKVRWKPKSAEAATATKSAAAPELDTPPIPELADDGSYIGVLVPPEAADLASRNDGKLMDVKVKVGDKVKRDKLLAVFDTRMLRHELAVAQAHLGAAADRSKRMGGTVNVGGQSVSIVAEGEKSSAQFDTSAAAARVEQLKASIELSEIRSPFDGVVTVVYSGAGNYLKAGTPVLRVIGDSSVKLRFAVPDDATNRPAVKSKVAVRLKDGRKLTGTVESVSAEVETASRTVFFDALIDDLPKDCGDGCKQLAARAVQVSSVLTGEH